MLCTATKAKRKAQVHLGSSEVEDSPTQDDQEGPELKKIPVTPQAAPGNLPPGKIKRFAPVKEVPG